MYEYSFIAPVVPPSVNSLYNVIKHPGRPLHVQTKPEVKLFKTAIKGFMPAWKYAHKGEIIYIKIVFYDENFYFKNGAIRKVDVTNIEKALVDAISEKIGIDDCYFKHVTRIHEPADKTRLSVEIVIKEPVG